MENIKFGKNFKALSVSYWSEEGNQAVAFQLYSWDTCCSLSATDGCTKNKQTSNSGQRDIHHHSCSNYQSKVFCFLKKGMWLTQS